VRGKWAAGIEPRNFTWVFKDKLAIAERPGGSTLVHRRVRRDEELRWLKNHKFTRMVSILSLPLNQEAYEEHHFASSTYPIMNDNDEHDVVRACFVDIRESMNRGDVILLHGDEVSDRLLGLVAGYLLWTGRVASDAIAIASVERLFRRSIAIEGREILKNLPLKEA